MDRRIAELLAFAVGGCVAVMSAACGGGSSGKECFSSGGTTMCLNPHPEGWARPGGAQFHGDVVRHGDNNCVSCHNEGSQVICTACHNSRGPGLAGIGGNLHPTTFSLPRSAISGNGLEPIGGGITLHCLDCHTGG